MIYVMVSLLFSKHILVCFIYIGSSKTFLMLLTESKNALVSIFDTCIYCEHLFLFGI